MTAPPSGADVAVIGGGVIGTQCALHFRRLRPDRSVILIDRDPFAYDSASCGNMGGFATCEVRPLASPENLLRALSWIFNPLAPLALRPRYAAAFAPWLAAFVKYALTPGHTPRVIAAQQQLMLRASDAHLAVVGGTPLSHLISDEGAIAVYRSRARMERDWSTRWRLFRERGEACDILSREDLMRRLPDPDASGAHGVHIPAIRHWKSPAALLKGLHEMAEGAGAVIVKGDATAISIRNGRAASVDLANGRNISCENVIVAGGAWSRALCASVGDKVPLDTERGYATTLPKDRLKIENLLLFPDDEFVATPMREGLRLGGTVEFAGLKAPPNFERTRALVTLMRRYFPALDDQGRTDWMGFRPSTPDGLPVIGQSPSAANVYYAFGHGHVGVTQSAITGALIAELIAGAPPRIDLAPYSIARFR